MKRIAIDMDQVMADFLSKFVSEFNRKFGLDVRVEELNGRKLEDFFPNLEFEIKEIIYHPNFFRDLPVMEDCVEVVRELSMHYEIFIATAAMEVPTSFNAKYEWLEEHFPFLNKQNIVFCGDKSIINADFLIDDNVNQLNRFNGEGILFSSPENQDVVGYKRVDGWKEVKELFVTVMTAIQ